MNLNQITLPALDLDNSIEFYQELGLELIVKSKGNYARFEMPNGDATLSLSVVNAISVDCNITIYFEVDDVDAEVKRLEKAGLKFEQQPQDESWLWREAILKDPAGNKIKIYHAGENRKNPPWRLE